MPRQKAVRYLLRIRAVTEGITPPIVRELLIDRDADVGQLARALKAAFGLSGCTRHQFTELRDPLLPDDTDLAELSEDALYDHQRRIYKHWPPVTSGRRWGDRWTMIDERDPQLTFENTVTVPDLFRSEHRWWNAGSAPSACPMSAAYGVPAAPTVFFRCDGHDPYSTLRAGRPWWFQVELVGDDIDLIKAPVARLVGGNGAAPFDGELGAHRCARVLAQWRDADSPEHSEARALIARAVGPWVTFDPDAFDLEGAHAEWAADLLEGESLPPGAGKLLDAVPATVRPGLRRHLATQGIGLPPVITAAQAEQAVSLFQRLLIEVIGGDGRPFDDAQADAAELVGGTSAAAELLELSRRLRLIYRRSGSWRVKRDALEAASDPLALWHRLASAVAELMPGTNRFLLLAIADGTIADEEAALERVAALDEASAHPSAAHLIGEWETSVGFARRSAADTRVGRVALDELRTTLMLLLPAAGQDGGLAASDTLREFARTCLR